MRKALLKEKEDFYLEIHADENNLGRIRDFVSDICAKAGFNKRETNNTKLAVDEACTNIIKHAYSGKSGDIKVHVEAEPGRVDIHLYDSGDSFDWSKIEDPDLEEYVAMGKKGGLGIYLMNRLMDDLDYTPSEDVNHLYMAKVAQSAVMGEEPLFVSIKPKWTQTLRFKFLLRASLGLFGLIAIVWLIQFVNLTREIEAGKAKSWLQIRNFARTLELRSENALVVTDPYDPEYRKLSEFIDDGMENYPAVKYIRVINKGGLIVSSSDVNEFERTYDIPAGVRGLPANGRWISPQDEDSDIREYHLPVLLSDRDSEKTADMGHIVVGVSAPDIEAGIEDTRIETSFILAGVFLAGIGLIYLLVAIFVKPIQTLTDGVRAIGEGSLEDELEIKGPKEIGAIAKAFNEITAKFRKAQESVVEQERMQKEIQVAQEIQHSLLPRKTPAVSGYDIASYYKAAKEVGGDYYDFMSVDEDTLGVVVADVSGKGVPGSLVMTMIRTALRMEARGNHSAADVMAKMNEFVTDDMKKGMFVTIFYVILDSRNRVISYASAGHNPMILYRAETEETFFLNPRGFPVGINLPDDRLFEKSIDVEKIKLKKDDMLLIYTDGVTEAMNERREQFGEKRLLELIRKNGNKSPQEFIDTLSGTIEDFTGNYPQNDDITLVSFKEKYMADEVLYGVRKKLLDLVTVEGMTVAEACRKMKVSPSTYYRYKKRLELMGERGLKNKTLRKEQYIRRLSNEQREGLIGIVEQNPEFGPKRIAERLNESRKEKDYVTEHLVYEELKRMRLNTFEKRIEYLRRNRKITEEEFEKMRDGGPLRRTESEKVAGKAKAGVEGIERTEEPGPEEKAQEEAAGAEAEDSEAFSGAGPPPEKVEAAPSDRGFDEKDTGYEEEELLQKAGYGEDSGVRIRRAREDEDIAVVKVSGHLDSSSTPQIEREIDDLYESGVDKIVVNLEEVSYISSGGWGIIVGRVKSLRDRDGDVVIAEMAREVFDVFELLGFQDIIMQFRTQEEAVEYLSLPLAKRRKKLKIKVKERKKKKAAVVEPGVKSEDAQDYQMSPLKIKAGSVGAGGEITVLELDGIIDTVSCQRLGEALDSIIEKGIHSIIADLSKVEYISSAGWGVFASRIEELREAGGDIKIFGMDTEVYTVFKLLEFDRVMSSFSILAEALVDFEVTRPEKSGATVDVDTERSRDADEPKAEQQAGGCLKVFVDRRDSGNKNGMVLEIEGAVDASTTDRFEENLRRLLLDGNDFAVLDLSGIEYINSGGWGIIAKYVQEFASHGIDLALAAMNPAVFKIFTDLGFEPLIPHFITKKEALRVLAEPAQEEEADDAGAVERVDTPEGPIEKSTGDSEGDSKEGPGTVYAEADETEKVRSPEIDEGGRMKLSESRKRAIGEREDGDFLNMDSETFDHDLDIDHGNIDRREEKDRKIRELGWGRYGEKLSKRNRNNKKGGGK